MLGGFALGGMLGGFLSRSGRIGTDIELLAIGGGQ